MWHLAFGHVGVMICVKGQQVQLIELFLWLIVGMRCPTSQWPP